MERNLDRRVEQLFPVENQTLKDFLKDMLDLQLQDNVGARILQSDGTYTWPKPEDNESVINSQEILLENRYTLFNLPTLDVNRLDVETGDEIPTQE